MTIRVLIADDETPARARVRAMLASHPECKIIGDVSDGAAAADAILHDMPDVVFLDIKMPELNGFEVLDALSATDAPSPAIVFVTAYDEFAVRAFEVGALDYLLKPFDRERFDKALASASDRIALRRLRAEHESQTSVDQFLRTIARTDNRPTRLLVRRGRQMQFIKVVDIDWLEAQGNYVRLHIAGRAHLLRETMTAMEAKLDPDTFIRVHRSATINIDRVAQFEPHLHGEFIITMRDGTRLNSSAAHGTRLRELLR